MSIWSWAFGPGGAIINTKPFAASTVGGGADESKMPWYIGPMLIIGAIILVIIVTKGFLKKQNIL